MQVDFNLSAVAHSNDKWHQVASGNKPLSSAISVPATYQAYLDLGRFRNALILDQAKCRPTVGLTNFIATYRLQPFKPVDTLTAKSN